ncbi:MAG: hypothetical protein LBH42_00125 [Treponema sp.]|jgi:hypothetical protein|nr:hypothetical protein [Treponema sp.]
MKKLSSFLFFFAVLVFPAFTDAGIQEELSYLLFHPNSSNHFANEEQGGIQLDNLAIYLKGIDLVPGQILVNGYAAVAENIINPLSLSKNRALFVINELKKRDIPGSVFTDPVAHGSVDLWGSNTDEEDRVLNRRVRIVMNGNILLPSSVMTVESEIRTSGMDDDIKTYKPESLAGNSGFNSPREIMLLLLGTVILAMLVFFAFKNRKSTGSHTGYPVNKLIQRRRI